MSSTATPFEPTNIAGRRLDFESLAGTDDTSWKRAVPYESDIECISSLGYRVRLPDSENWHVVVLGREDGEHVGLCDCKGFEYNDGPCAHLCAVRKAGWEAVSLERDINGRKIRIVDIADIQDEDRRDLSYLPPKQRAAYEAVEIDGMGVREYQRSQGYSSPGTVSNQLRKAREKVEEHERELAAQGEPAVARDGLTDDRQVTGEGVSR